MRAIKQKKVNSCFLVQVTLIITLPKCFSIMMLRTRDSNFSVQENLLMGAIELHSLSRTKIMPLNAFLISPGKEGWFRALDTRFI